MRGRISFIILSVSISMILTGCKYITDAVTTKKPDLDRALCFETEISAYDDMKVCGTVSRFGTGLWEMDISSPETMAGLHISRTDGGVKARLDGLELEIPAERLNKNDIFGLISSAVDNFAALPDASLCEKDGVYEYTGGIPQGEYIMTFDMETSALTCISFPERNVRAEIKMTDGGQSSPETAGTAE